MTAATLDPDAPPRPNAHDLDTCDAYAGRLFGIASRAGEGDGGARATLARLRRALGRRGVDARALAEVGDLIPWTEPPLSDDDLGDYLLVAALLATQAAGTKGLGGASKTTSFGGSARRLRQSLSVGAGSLDQRFQTLLDARREDLPYRLRQIVGLIAREGVGVRYGLLLHDLLHWDDPTRNVQRRWARDYWVGDRSSSTR